MKKGYRFVKTTVDIFASFIGVLILSPLFLLLIVLIDLEGCFTKSKNKKKVKEAEEVATLPENDETPGKIDEPACKFVTKTYFGGAILGQERLGKNKKKFFLFKFRSMKEADEKFDCKKQTVEEGDSRVTLIGKFIRRFKIDELLQLINVLRGDMNLVGPRPLLPEYAEEYAPWMEEKFLEKPGMTGLAQVNGGTYLSLEERSYFDVYYVRKVNAAMDIKILFKTIAVIFVGEKKLKKDVSQEDIASFIGESYYAKKENSDQTKE